MSQKKEPPTLNNAQEPLKPAAQPVQPGDGLRSLRSTTMFRAINFELYAKPNAIIMGIGLVCITGCIGYIAYMRSKYESQGYYAAINPDDGTEQFMKKKSKWE